MFKNGVKNRFLSNGGISDQERAIHRGGKGKSGGKGRAYRNPVVESRREDGFESDEDARERRLKPLGL